MKKIMVLFLLVLGLSGCNMQVIDTVWSFEYAECKMSDGSSEVFELKSWKNFEDGDMLQFTTKDGTTYLTHSVNCYLRNK